MTTLVELADIVADAVPEALHGLAHDGFSGTTFTRDEGGVWKRVSRALVVARLERALLAARSKLQEKDYTKAMSCSSRLANMLLRHHCLADGFAARAKTENAMTNFKAKGMSFTN